MTTKNRISLNVIALVTNEDRYLFVYDDAHIPDCLRTIDRFAASRELSLTEAQAAILRRRIYEATGISEPQGNGLGDRMKRADTEERASEPGARRWRDALGLLLFAATVAAVGIFEQWSAAK